MMTIPATTRSTGVPKLLTLMMNSLLRKVKIKSITDLCLHLLVFLPQMLTAPPVAKLCLHLPMFPQVPQMVAASPITKLHLSLMMFLP